MRVFRVEHEESGRGPYNHQYGYDLLPTRYWNMPEPSVEIAPGTDYSGFASIADLSKWFHKTTLKSLARKGFVVRQYSVRASHIKRCTGQLVFTKDEAKLVKESIALNSF